MTSLEINKANLTLEEKFFEFQRSRRKSINTIKGYENMIGKLKENNIEITEESLKSITFIQAQTIIEKMETDLDDNGKPKYSHSTIAKFRERTGAIYKFIGEKGNNPFSDAEQMRNTVSKETKTFQPHEIGKLMSELKKEDIRVQAMISLLANTGVRVNELASINRYESGILELDEYGEPIPESYLDIKNESLILYESKTKRMRTIPIGDSTLNIIKKYLKTRTDDKQYLFLQKRKVEKMEECGFKFIINKYTKDKVGWGSAKIYRSTMASILGDYGLSSNIISDKIGHKKEGTTGSHYKQTSKPKLKEVANLLEELIDVEVKKYEEENKWV